MFVSPCHNFTVHNEVNIGNCLVADENDIARKQMSGIDEERKIEYSEN